MAVFNATLVSELSGSGALKVVEKKLYPLNVPQQAHGFQARRRVHEGLVQSAGERHASRVRLCRRAERSARHSRMAVQSLATRPRQRATDRRASCTSALATPTGARKTAREFAAEILAAFGVKSLEGTKIYFVSDRTGHKEIWSMDHDGSNQRQLTRHATITQSPVVSPDGKWLAYTTMFKRPGSPIDSWNIVIQSTITGEKAKFANPMRRQTVGLSSARAATSCSDRR